MVLSNKKPFKVENKISIDEYIGYSEFRKTLINASKKEYEAIVTEDEKIIFKILEQNIKNAARSKEESYSIRYWDFVKRESLNMTKYNINISKKEFEDLMLKFAKEKGLEVTVSIDQKFDCLEAENGKELGAIFIW